MNDAEMHCTLDVAMFASVARSAPRYGTGTGVKSLDWREHLLGSFTPLENARELLAIVGLRRSAHLTPDIAQGSLTPGGGRERARARLK
jgi:hypothetical protein